MAKKLKRVTAALCSVLMAVCLSGCGSDIDKPASEATDLNAVSESDAGQEKDVNIPNESAEKLIRESYLPPNMSMNDLLNMIQIDGQTISLPTTIEEILSVNNDFSVEMSFSKLYETPEECIEDIGGVNYSINYKNDELFEVGIQKNDYNGDYLTSKIYMFPSGFNINKFDNSNLNFNIVNEIGFGCTLDKVIETFGEPNSHSNFTNAYAYEFYDNYIIFKMTIQYYVNEEENDIYNKHICAMNIKIERV